MSMGSASLTSLCTDNSQIVSCEFYVCCVLEILSSALSLRLYNVADNNVVIKAINSW